MAAVPPIVANTNFGQWQSWQKVTDPSGASNYYVVPGYGGRYVYDPFASEATGKITLYENPQSVYDAANEAIKQEEDANSLLAQGAVPLGALAGTLGTKWVAGQVADKGSQAIGQAAAQEAAKGFGNTATQQVAQQTAQAGTAGVGGTIGGAAPAAVQGFEQSLGGVAPSSVSSTAPAAEVGTFDAGGPIGSNIGTVAQGALGAAGLGIGLKGAYDAFEAGDPVGGAISGAGAGAGGLALAGALGASTGGLALPIIAGAALLGGAGGFFGGHESTREHAMKNTGKLLDKNPDDEKYQAYVQGMREQFQSEPPDPSKPFAGKYATWDEYKKAGLEAQDLTGVFGNIETFGSDWTNLSFEQQVGATQQLINAGLYDSKKGEVVITDKGKAQKVFNDFLSGGGGEGEAEPEERKFDPVTDQELKEIPEPQQRPTPQPEGGFVPYNEQPLPGMENLTPEQQAEMLAKLLDNTAPNFGKAPQATYGGG